MSRPTTPHADRPAAPRITSPVARLRRPGAGRAADVTVAEREHATEVVAHLLHAECGQWSWNTHAAGTHREEAQRIVGALCREGWAPGRSAA